MAEEIFSASNHPSRCLPDESAFASGSGTERKSTTCLVVEDDATMRHLVTNYLEDHDIRAIAASRRDEVAGLLTRSQPDLVVLDLRLGQEDGLAAGISDVVRWPIVAEEVATALAHGLASRAAHSDLRRHSQHHHPYVSEAGE
jgi:PleD family two-component response regulator